MKAAIVVLLLLTGCGAPFLRQGTATWAAAHLPNYTAYVLVDPMLDAAAREQTLMTISALQCTLDEDADDPLSLACACARAASEERRTTDCGAWVRGLGL